MLQSSNNLTHVFLRCTPKNIPFSIYQSHKQPRCSISAYQTCNAIQCLWCNAVPYSACSTMQCIISLVHKYLKEVISGKISCFLYMSMVELNHFNITCDFTSLCMPVLSSFSFCFSFIRSVLSKVAQLT